MKVHFGATTYTRIAKALLEDAGSRQPYSTLDIQLKGHPPKERQLGVWLRKGSAGKPDEAVIGASKRRPAGAIIFEEHAETIPLQDGEGKPKPLQALASALKEAFTRARTAPFKPVDPALLEMQNR